MQHSCVCVHVVDHFVTVATQFFSVVYTASLILMIVAKFYPDYNSYGIERINDVILCRATLILRWATACVCDVLVFNQATSPSGLAILPWVRVWVLMMVMVSQWPRSRRVRGVDWPPTFWSAGSSNAVWPPLLTKSKRAQDCENAVHRHKVKVY